VNKGGEDKQGWGRG